MTMEPFIGVVCGLKSEADVVSAVVAASKVKVGVSGANAARAEELALDFCAHGAAAIVSVGVSGGLDPVLRPGDLCVASQVIGDDGDVYDADHYLMGVITSSFETLHSLHPEEGRRPVTKGEGNETPQDEVIVGAMFGADEIIDSAGKKAALFQNHGCLAVDMESHGAARAAARAGVPFIAIRAIADPSDRALPPAALNAVAQDGSTRTLATLGAALRDPKQFPALIKLGADSSAALKTLRRDLGPIFGRFFLSLDL